MILRMNAEFQPAVPRRYDILITKHARERWVTRIADPERFTHLNSCKRIRRNCSECGWDLNAAHSTIRECRRGIDIAIVSAYRRARDDKMFVTDENFKEAIRKRYGEKNLKFYNDGRAVFVVLDPAPDLDIPVLLTIMTPDMIDGMVFQVMEPADMKAVFDRWKREMKRK